MDDDHDYLKKYAASQVYTNPSLKGTYATICGESDEELIGEVGVTSRSKLCVSAFYVKDRADFGTFKLTKMKWHAKRGWEPDGALRINAFQLQQIDEFIRIISHLDLGDADKVRLPLKGLHAKTLSAILASPHGPTLLKELADNPDIHEDIYAVAAKRRALAEFEILLNADVSEKDWQRFFEANPWVFGHGLNYVFLDRATSKLEATTTGSMFDKPGKIVDALLKTRAAISQFVLVEIKKSSTDLLDRRSPYRSGCWGVSAELSNAVTQVQKTTFEFARSRFREQLRDAIGNDLGELAYSIEPRSYLVIGNLRRLVGNDDQISCFELFRRNMRSPEIITFDELYERARCIVDNVSSRKKL